MVTEEWNKEMYELFKSNAYVNEGFVVKILNCFVHFGPNGNHFCIVLEPLGPSLQNILDEAEANGIDIELKILTKIQEQILTGLHFIHEKCKLIHTDVKPSNYRLSLDYSDMAKIESQNFDRHHNLVLFRSKEIQREMKLKSVKQTIDQSTKKLSKKERKKLKKKMKKLEKKMIKNTEQHVEMMKEQKQNMTSILGTNLSENQTHRGRQRFQSADGKKLRNDKNLSGVSDLQSKENEYSHGRSTSRKNKFLRSNSSKSHDKQKYNFNKILENPILSVLHTKNFQLKLTNFWNARHQGTSIDNADQLYNQNAPCSSNISDGSKDIRCTVTTRPYRAPEIILNMAYGKMIDVWSVGCVFFNLFCYEQLFLPEANQNFTIDEDHLAQILELRATNPKIVESDNRFLKSAPKYKTFFDYDHNLKNIKFVPQLNLSDYMVDNFRINPKLAARISSVLLELIQLNPGNRTSPLEILKNNPNFERLKKQSSEETQQYRKDSLVENQVDLEQVFQSDNVEELTMFDNPSTVKTLDKLMVKEEDHFADIEDFNIISDESTDEFSCKFKILSFFSRRWDE